MTGTTERTVTIKGFRLALGPASYPADEWEARCGLPDLQETLRLLARAEEGICIYLDVDSSEECGDDTQPDQRYCARHTEEMDDAGEETSLQDWRSEIAQMSSPLAPTSGRSRG